MSRWFAVLLPVLGGCIIYDHDGKCWDCAPDEQVGPNDQGLDGDEDTAGPEDSGATQAGYKFLLDPAEAYPGDTFIAHLTQTGNFDLSQVTGAQFLDAGAEVLASETAADEILLTISVRGDAVPATLSMLLQTADGGNEYVPDVLTILASDGNHTGGDTGGCN